MIKQIESEAKKYFEKASGCHDWTHVERVRNLALKIGRKEKADLGILEIAALLHDICKS
ncbi:MAG: phosphohydrolase, partial [Candidatus Portnoybacteria bacterium CG_4_10_14_0_2_um_filter_44_20]